MVSTLAFPFKIIRDIIFSAVKNVSFPQSKNFSTIKEFFHKLRNFSIFKKLLQNQGTFPQSWKFSTVKEIFSKKNYLIEEIFYTKETFPQSKKCFANKDQEDSLKAQILDPFKY